MILDLSSLQKAISQLEEALEFCRSELAIASKVRVFGSREESDLPYTVDVINLPTVNESFKAIIEQARVELFL